MAKLFPRWVPRGLIVAIVGALLFSLLTPIAALADTNLVIGGTARIAYADGDPVALRGAAGYDADFTVVDELDASERGLGGFGHSGR